MLLSSFAFYFAFPASDYVVLDDSNRPMSTSVLRSFVHIANPYDILVEVPFVSPAVKLTVDTIEMAANLFKKPTIYQRHADDEAVLLSSDGRAAGNSTDEENL
jgi:hypothetical protein